MPLFQSHPNEAYTFPLGIPYISAAMKKAGFQVFTLNLNHHHKPYEVLKTKIIENKIDVVMTGGLSPQFAQVKTVFDVALDTDPEIITICGGGLISGDPSSAMNALDNVDIGVIGEGEVTIVELCNSLEERNDLLKVSGLVLCKYSEYIKTDHRKEIKDINTIPWPDYDGFDYDKAVEISNTFSLMELKLPDGDDDRVAMLLTSRSCPYSCTFCFHTSGKKYRQRNLDDVFAEIDFLVTRYNIRFLSLQDELLAASKKRLKDFCDRISKYNLRWNAVLRVENATEDVVAMLKKANCIQINFGVESADDSILKSMKKRITVAQIESALENTYNAQIPVLGNLIFGDINETDQTVKNTLDWWHKNKRYGIRLRMIKVYPGTFLYSYAVKNNIISDPVEFCKQCCPPVNVSKLTKTEVGRLVYEIAILPFREGSRFNTSKTTRVDYDKKTFSVIGHCCSCKQQSSWDDISPFSRRMVYCKYCNTAQLIGIPKSLAEIIEHNLKKIITSGITSLAVWGMAGYLLDFIKKTETLFEDDRIYFVDESTDAQLMRVCGKKVYSPNLIKEKKIDCIIVAVGAYFSIIEPRIRQMQNDAEILSMNDLLNTDIS